MSRHAQINATWADDDYNFRLAIGQLRELQEKTDCGPAYLLQRLTDGSWRVDDIRETIRLGLIGGGMEPGRAIRLTRLYVDERPLIENIPLARAILLAALLGAEDEPVGKKGPAEESTSDQTESSPSPASTDQAEPLDIPRQRSTA